MPDSRDLHPAESCDRVGDRLRGDCVDDDDSPGFLGEFSHRDHRGDHGGIHHLAPLVNQEASIRITVEDQPEIGFVLAHRSLGIRQILQLQGVCRMIREAAVWFHVQPDQFDVPSGQDSWGYETSHSVPRVDNHCEPSSTRHRHQLVQMDDELGGKVTFLVAALHLVPDDH